MTENIKNLHSKLTGLTPEELEKYLEVIKEWIPLIITGLKVAKLFTNDKIDAIIDEIIALLRSL